MIAKSRHYIHQRHERVAKRTIRPLNIRPLHAQNKNPRDGQRVKNQDRKHHVIEQIAIEIPVGDQTPSDPTRCVRSKISTIIHTH